MLGGLTVTGALLSGRDALAQAETGELTPEQVLADADMPFIGSPNADVTIVEFIDYNCGYCRKTHPHLRKLIENDAGVRVLYREWPVFGPVSEYAAKMAIAAKFQDRYEAAHNALMSGRAGYKVKETVRAALRQAGIDMERLDRDASDNAARIEKLIARNSFQADSIGLKGTPSWFIESFVVEGGLGYADLQAAVAEARRRKAENAPAPEQPG